MLLTKTLAGEFFTRENKMSDAAFNHRTMEKERTKDQDLRGPVACAGSVLITACNRSYRQYYHRTRAKNKTAVP